LAKSDGFFFVGFLPVTCDVYSVDRATANRLEGFVKKWWRPALDSFGKKYPFLRANAEDWVEEAIVSIVERLEKGGGLQQGLDEIEKMVAPVAYLCTVARNRFVDESRKVVQLPRDANDEGSRAYRPFEDKQTLRQVYDSICELIQNELTGQQQEIARRVLVYEQRQVDVAASLGISPSTVNEQLRRAKERILARIMFKFGSEVTELISPMRTSAK
jgi:RNA polymerase sigma factor (sigma-70 family)